MFACITVALFLYIGLRCDIDKNGCLSSPCKQSECSDLSPEEEVYFGRPVNCSQCFSGFVRPPDSHNDCKG